MLDASVVAKWFHSAGEPDLQHAETLREGYRRGELVVFAPSLLPLELLNVAAKRWGATRAQLVGMAQALTQLGFTYREPDLERVANWTDRGLTAYDSSYVALAEERGIVVVTADQRLLAVAGTFATALNAV